MKRLSPLAASALAFASVALAADSTQPFAQDFVKAVAKDAKDPNTVFSPFSISQVLELARAGADGETKAELDKVLHGTPARLEHEGVQVSNHIWAQAGFGIREDWKVLTLDFKADPGKARKTINDRIAKETHERIKDLIPEPAIDRDTKLVLTNAVHLDAKWEHPFEKDATHDAPFHLADGTTVSVPTMHQDLRFGLRYGAKDGLEVVELPYKGTLVFTVVMPKDIAKHELDLDAALALLAPKSARLALPKLELTQAIDMKPALESLGMKTAFTDEADFSKFTGKRELRISAAVTKTFIRVDEEGTEAAAASAIVMKPTAAAPAPLTAVKVDRPFYFAIRETKTGSIVFFGKIGKPVAPGKS